MALEQKVKESNAIIYQQLNGAPRRQRIDSHDESSFYEKGKKNINQFVNNAKEKIEEAKIGEKMNKAYNYGSEKLSDAVETGSEGLGRMF